MTWTEAINKARMEGAIEATRNINQKLDSETVEEFAECIVSELPAIKEPSQWQDISTAPKDGTKILAWGVSAGEINGINDEAEACVIFWNGGSSDYQGYEWTVPTTDAYAVWFRPVLWQPITPPDKEKQ